MSFPEISLYSYIPPIMKSYIPNTEWASFPTSYRKSPKMLKFPSTSTPLGSMTLMLLDLKSYKILLNQGSPCIKETNLTSSLAICVSTSFTILRSEGVEIPLIFHSVSSEIPD